MSDYEGLRAAARELDAWGDAEVLDGLDATLALWREEGGYAERAARELAASTGASEDMLRFGLDRVLAAHSRSELERWLEEARAEAGGAERGPEAVVQVLAGNVAGLALPAALEALLARSAVLLKPAEDDPVTASLFVESLERAAPALAGAAVVRRWKGGEDPQEEAILDEADLVIASGGEEMVASLSSRLRRPPVIYGPRISVGLVGAGWTHAPEPWWREVAREIVLWDQRGCLSPRILFVMDERDAFARKLGKAFAKWQESWPARPRTAGEAAAIHGFRVRYEMGDGREIGLLTPGDTAWTLAWDADSNLTTGPPSRLLRIAPKFSLEVMEGLFREHPGWLQGVGIAFLEGHEPAWREALSHFGIGRVAPLTSLQDPPAGWRADGRSGLAELLKRGRAAA